MKTIIITGASSGLGEQLAYSCAKAGYKVILGARNISKLDDVVKRCNELNQSKNHFFELDLTKNASIEKFYHNSKTCGAPDCLINCAGYGLFAEFIEIPQEVIADMFKVNVLGLMYLTQLFAIDFAKMNKGQIINVASQAGKIASPKSVLYSATKFAVLGFSNALRLELRPANVTVTTVNPGPIKTPFFEKADLTGNYLAKIGRLALEPEYLAKKIVRSIGTNKREINSPLLMELGSKLYTLAPRVGDYCTGTLFNKK